MKLAYLQSCENPLDPLPKLGKKVEPRKPNTDPYAHIKAFEIGEHSIKPQRFGVDLAKPAKPFIEDDSKTVSFADVGEMSDLDRYYKAWDAAVRRVGFGPVVLARNAVFHQYAPGWSEVESHPEALPAAIAALEALR